MDAGISRVESNAFASCSSPCSLHIGVRRQPSKSHIQFMARPRRSASRKQTSTMASGKQEGGNFNPFRNKKKEDAAKKALEEMFGGKEDLLAAYDTGGGGNFGKGGGRRGGGGGGGDDAEGGSFDFRQWMANMVQGLGKTGRSLGKTVAAILLLLSIFYASSFIKPLMRVTIQGLRWVLRLDGAGSRRVRRQPAAAPAESMATLGEHERSILSKYAQDDDEDLEEQSRQPGSPGDQEDD